MFPPVIHERRQAALVPPFKNPIRLDLCPASVFLRARDFAIAYLQFAPV
jgi:hypothetical protein